MIFLVDNNRPIACDADIGKQLKTIMISQRPFISWGPPVFLGRCSSNLLVVAHLPSAAFHLSPGADHYIQRRLPHSLCPHTPPT